MAEEKKKRSLKMPSDKRNISIHHYLTRQSTQLSAEVQAEDESHHRCD
jgi:hypothetical protein